MAGINEIDAWMCNHFQLKKKGPWCHTLVIKLSSLDMLRLIVFLERTCDGSSRLCKLSGFS